MVRRLSAARSRPADVLLARRVQGLILGVIEGIQLVFMNMFKDQYSPVRPDPAISSWHIALLSWA